MVKVHTTSDDNSLVVLVLSCFASLPSTKPGMDEVVVTSSGLDSSFALASSFSNLTSRWLGGMGGFVENCVRNSNGRIWGVEEVFCVARNMGMGDGDTRGEGRAANASLWATP